MSFPSVIYTLNPKQQAAHRAKVFHEDGKYYVLLINAENKCFIDPIVYRIHMEMIVPVVLSDSVYHPIASRILKEYLKEFNPMPIPIQRIMDFNEPKRKKKKWIWCRKTQILS